MELLRTEEDLATGVEKLILKHPPLVPVAEVAQPLILHTHTPGFAGLARVIIAQQVSTASAAAVYKRFTRYIKPLTPIGYLDAGENTWIEIGLTRPKQRALKEVSNALVSGELDLSEIPEMDVDEAIRQLTSIKGIGPWTAEVYLLMCAENPDIFPATDLALQEAIRMAFDLEKRPDEKATREIASKWTPLRGFAANLFWSYYLSIKEGRSEALSKGGKADPEPGGLLVSGVFRAGRRV